MKKIIAIAAVLLALIAVVGCASKPATPTPAPVAATAKFEILQHKGTTMGVTTPPSWVEAAINGPKAVEKLADYKDQYVVIVDVTGQSLDGVQLAAANLNATTEVSRYLSLRVKDTFAGAQVGDKDKIETYMERAVKSVSDATFSGFTKSADWWVQLRWYKPENPKAFDHDEYRYLALYTIPQDVLKQQLDKILAGAASAEQQVTPDKQKAMDLVQQSFYDGF